MLRYRLFISEVQHIIIPTPLRIAEFRGRAEELLEVHFYPQGLSYKSPQWHLM